MHWHPPVSKKTSTSWTSRGTQVWSPAFFVQNRHWWRTRSAFVVHTSSVGRHHLCAVQHSKLAWTSSLLCRITWHSFITRTHQTHVTSCQHMEVQLYLPDDQLWMQWCSPTRLEPLLPPIQGQVFHRIRSLLSQADQPPQFLQVYFTDNHFEETNTCKNTTTGLKEHIVNNLSKMLHQCNQSVQLLKTARELLERDDLHPCQVVINEERRPPGDHARRFNVPISDEIGILMPNELTHNQDIVV